MKTKIFKILIIILFVTLLITIANIAYSQDDDMLFTIIEQFESIQGIPESGIDELTDEEKAFIDELKEIAAIPEDERTPEQWKRIIYITLTLNNRTLENSIDSGSIILALIEDNAEALEEIAYYRELYYRSEQEKNNIVNQLSLLQNQYNTLLDISNNRNYNTIYIGPILGFNTDFSINVGYMTNIDFISLGGNLMLDIKPSVNLSIGISIGYNF